MLKINSNGYFAILLETLDDLCVNFTPRVSAISRFATNHELEISEIK